jgi:hypothetical protein
MQSTGFAGTTANRSSQSEFFYNSILECAIHKLNSAYSENLVPDAPRGYAFLRRHDDR